MTTSPAGGGSSDVKAGTPAFLGGKGATVLRTSRGCLQKKPAEAETALLRAPVSVSQVSHACHVCPGLQRQCVSRAQSSPSRS